MSTQTQTAVALFSQYKDEASYNILTPAVAVMAVQNPFMTVYANVIKFTPDDTYPVDGGKLALNSRALARIASAAGIDIVRVHRTDDGRNPDFCEVEVLAVMKRPDGSPITVAERKSLDINAYIEQQVASQTAKQAYAQPEKRKTEAQIRADAERDRLQLRKFRAERCTTGATSRAIRRLLAMKPAYSRDELNKPFVVPQTTVNMQEIVRTEFGRNMAISAMLTGMQQAFGQAALPAHDIPLPAEPSAALPAPEGTFQIDDDDTPAMPGVDMATGEVVDEPMFADAVPMEEPPIPSDEATPFDGPTFDPTPAPKPVPAKHAKNGKAVCPECGGEMWDNRAKKASGQYKANAPDFGCKDKNCSGKIWPAKNATPAPAENGNLF